MQFIKDEELESIGSPNDGFVDLVLPGHHELQHHEVGQDDVRRILGYAVTLLAFLLACIAREGDWFGATRVAQLQEASQFFALAVGQCIHWINDDGANARLLVAGGTLAQDVVDDRDEVAQ